MRIRSTAAIATLACAVGASLFAAAPANAATPHCNGSLCAELIAANSSSFKIEEYTVTQFTGHFQLQTPEHTTYNSPDTTYGLGSGHTFTVSAVDGSYCANQWKKNSTGAYDRIGGVCWTINT